LTQFEKYLLSATVCVALFSGFGVRYFEGPRALSRTFSIPLKTAASSGMYLRVQMDPQACSDNLVGELRCDLPYQARYDRPTNTWSMTGKDRDTDKTAFYRWSNAPREPGTIGLWGIVVASFDDAGIIYLDGGRVGKLQIMTGETLYP
jgi:hypothetical protein